MTKTETETETKTINVSIVKDVKLMTIEDGKLMTFEDGELMTFEDGKLMSSPLYENGTKLHKNESLRKMLKDMKMINKLQKKLEKMKVKRTQDITQILVWELEEQIISHGVDPYSKEGKFIMNWIKEMYDPEDEECYGDINFVIEEGKREYYYNGYWI